MPKAPRGKRVVDAKTGAFTVVNKAPNGEAEPFYDNTRSVWVAPWRKPNGKVGRPTGRTRALAVASRDRHIAKLAEDAKFASSLAGGFTAESTVSELTEWWLQNIARHRVRATTFATYRKQLRLVDEGLGSIPARELRPEQIAGFVSDLIDRGSASRARNIRTLLVQVMDQAVELGLATENVAKRVKTPKVPRVKRRTVTPDETRRLLLASDPRFAAAIALCYVQGWRVSEALGLAWQDLDLETGSVRLRRGATYADGVGMVLGPTKTERTAGVQMIGPTVIALLEARRKVQDDDRKKLDEAWPMTEYDGERLDLVFTAANGNPMLRQKVDKAIRTAAEKAGVDSKGLGTHAGRRSVVTNLFASGSLDLEDVARFVGHTDTATTRGYVQHEGDRPRQISVKALELLDPNWSPDAPDG